MADVLSSSHAVFCDLQEHLRALLKGLPDDVDPTRKKALTSAHRKLSDYFYKFDQSEYYTWAARKCLLSILKLLLTFQFSILVFLMRGSVRTTRTIPTSLPRPGLGKLPYRHDFRCTISPRQLLEGRHAGDDLRVRIARSMSIAFDFAFVVFLSSKSWISSSLFP
jgi:hypothetical protein